MKKKFYSLVLLLGLPLMACAQEKIGNLWYSASETGVTVIQSQDDTEYAGDIIIPAMVTYSGKESLVTSIDEEAFTGCSNLTSISIPASVEEIGVGAFTMCSNLKFIYIDRGNQKYHDGGFNSIVEVASKTLLVGTTKGYIPYVDGGPRVTTIGRQAFAGREIEDQYVSIAEGVVKIDELAFVKSSITEVYIPTTLKECGFSAFSYPALIGGESKITRVEIVDLSAWFDIDFDSFGSNPLSDGADLYLNGQLLNSITIPEDIEIIKPYALVGWNGTEIVIPNTVKGIGASAFENCDNLESVTCHITANEIFDVPQNIISQECTLYVPKGAAESYIAKGWGEYFTSIVEMEPASFTLNISAAKYATLYLAEAVEIPQNVEVYTASEVGNGYVYMTPVIGVIPANTGVVVRAAEGTYDFVYYTGDAVSAIQNNLFKGTIVNEHITPSKGKIAYVLSAYDGEVGLYRAKLTNGQFLNNAHKAYLEVLELSLNEDEVDTSSQQLSLKFKFPEASNIENIEQSTNSVTVYYDLQGRKVLHPTHGLYILNGKKVYVK